MKQSSILFRSFILLLIISAASSLIITSVLAGRKKYKSFSFDNKLIPSFVKVKPNRFHLTFRQSKTLKLPTFKIEGELPLKAPTIVQELPPPPPPKVYHNYHHSPPPVYKKEYSHAPQPFPSVSTSKIYKKPHEQVYADSNVNQQKVKPMIGPQLPPNMNPKTITSSPIHNPLQHNSHQLPMQPNNFQFNQMTLPSAQIGQRYDNAQNLIQRQNFMPQEMGNNFEMPFPAQAQVQSPFFPGNVPFGPMRPQMMPQQTSFPYQGANHNHNGLVDAQNVQNIENHKYQKVFLNPHLSQQWRPVGPGVGFGQQQIQQPQYQLQQQSYQNQQQQQPQASKVQGSKKINIGEYYKPEESYKDEAVSSSSSTSYKVPAETADDEPSEGSISFSFSGPYGEEVNPYEEADMKQYEEQLKKARDYVPPGLSPEAFARYYKHHTFTDTLKNSYGYVAKPSIKFGFFKKLLG